MFKPVGAVMAGVVHEAVHGGDKDFLRTHPGEGAHVLTSGMGRIAATISPAQKDDFEQLVRAEYAKGEPLCESPIEREMLAALLTGNWGRAFASRQPKVFNIADRNAPLPDSEIVVIPQFPIGRRRLDFAVSVPKGPIGTLVAIECDGKDYHNRQSDGFRDGELAHYGIITLRASGSKIRGNPIGTADILIEAILEWAGQ